MPNGEKAKIFEVIKDTMKAQGIDTPGLAHGTGIDKTWLYDFMADGKVCEQTIRLRKIEKFLGICPLPEEYYEVKHD